MNFFMEVAKMRAARLLWAKLLTPFNPKDPRSLSLRNALPDLGLVADRAGRLQQRDAHHHRGDGGDARPHQSLHTNALDEALALPTDFSARIARNTQLFLQQESAPTASSIPGAARIMSNLTHDLAAKAWGHIQEVEALGGMAKAIEAGVPKLRIEEASAKTQSPHRRRQAGGDRRQQVQTNRRKRRSTSSRWKIPPCAGCRSTSCRACAKSASRKDVDDALAALTRSAGEGNGNLLALAIDARAPRPQSAKFPMRWKKFLGRHRAEIKSITGVYKREASTMSNRVEKSAGVDRCIRGRRRPPAAHSRRQDRPGRPRPRPEGDRLGLCRCRL